MAKLRTFTPGAARKLPESDSVICNRPLERLHRPANRGKPVFDQR